MLSELGFQTGYRACLELVARCRLVCDAAIGTDKTSLELLIGTQVCQVDSGLAIDGYRGAGIADCIWIHEVVTRSCTCNQTGVIPPVEREEHALPEGHGIL